MSVAVLPSAARYGVRTASEARSLSELRDLEVHATPVGLQEVTADGDVGSLFYVARALHRLQAQLGGTAAHIRGKGPSAAAVRDLLARFRSEDGPSPAPLGAAHRLSFISSVSLSSNGSLLHGQGIDLRPNSPCKLARTFLLYPHAVQRQC